MIDVHCHLLPGIDDGPTAIEDSLEMARAAVADGVSGVICTPHDYPGVFDTPPAAVIGACRALQQRFEIEDIDLTLRPAAELRFDLSILERAEAGTLPTLGVWAGREAVLMEFPSTTLPVGAQGLMRRLLASGYQPVIAHPERNAGFLAEPGYLHALHEQGCRFQITGSALLGDFGRRAGELAEYMLGEALVTFIASDAHDPVRRPLNLSLARDRAAELVGADVAGALVEENPHELWGH